MGGAEIALRSTPLRQAYCTSILIGSADKERVNPFRDPFVPDDASCEIPEADPEAMVGVQGKRWLATHKGQRVQHGHGVFRDPSQCG